MNIAGEVFLIALGAVLAFAVEDSDGGLNVAVVGWILMATGAVLLRLEWGALSPRRRMIGTSTAIKEVRVAGDRRSRILVRAPRSRTPRPSVPGRTGRQSVQGSPRPWDEFDNPA